MVDLNHTVISGQDDLWEVIGQVNLPEMMNLVRDLCDNYEGDIRTVEVVLRCEETGDLINVKEIGFDGDDNLVLTFNEEGLR